MRGRRRAAAQEDVRALFRAGFPGSLCAQVAQDAVGLMTRHRFGDEDNERVLTETNPQDLIRRVTGEGPHGHLVRVVREDRPWCIPPHVVTDSLVRCPEAGRLLVGVAVAAVDHTVQPNLRGALVRDRPFWGLRTASASRHQSRHRYGHGSALYGKSLPSGHTSKTSNVQQVFPPWAAANSRRSALRGGFGYVRTSQAGLTAGIPSLARRLEL